MRCGTCNEYIPEGIDIESCPSCNNQITTENTASSSEELALRRLSNSDLFASISNSRCPPRDAEQREWERRRISAAEVTRLKKERDRLTAQIKNSINIPSDEKNKIRNVINVAAWIFGALLVGTVITDMTHDLLSGEGIGASVTFYGFILLGIMVVTRGLRRYQNWARYAFLVFYVAMMSMAADTFFGPEESAVWYEHYFSFGLVDQILCVGMYAAATFLAVYLLQDSVRTAFTNSSRIPFSRFFYAGLVLMSLGAGVVEMVGLENLKLKFKIENGDLKLVLKDETWTAPKEDPSWLEKHADEPVVYQILEKKVKLNPDFTFEESQHIVMRIQNEEGKKVGEIPVEYNVNYQEILQLEGFVKTPEGKVYPANSVQDYNPFSNDAMYSDNRVKVVTMPNVVPGSMIDLRIKILNKRPVLPKSFAYSFGFLNSVSVHQNFAELIIPKDVHIEIKNRNLNLKPKIEETGKNKIYRWAMTDPDKFEPELAMPPLDELAQDVMVNTISDWNVIGKWFAALVEDNVRISDEMKKTVKKLISGKPTEGEKAQAILKYIWDHFRYVSMSLGKNNYEPHPSDQVFANNYGDCKDQTTLAIALFREAGIKASPALFRPESLGNPQKELPAPTAFGHVILKVELDGKHHFIDVLAKGYRYDQIPYAHEGAYLLIGDSKGGVFEQIPILDAMQHRQVKNNKIILHPDGSALIETSSIWELDNSIKTRSDWKTLTQKEKEQVYEVYEKVATNGGKVIERNWNINPDDYGPISSFVKYEQKAFAQVIAGTILTFGASNFGQNPGFLIKQRKYPIVSLANDMEEEHTTFFIPKGYKIQSIPEDLHSVSDLEEFHRTYERQGDQIVEHLIKRTKRAHIPVDAYSKIQDFYEELQKKAIERVTIIKS